MNFHSVENEILLSRTDTSVELEFLVPAESDLFDGHFPEFKLLPAVGQFDFISRFAVKYFAIPRNISSVKRMKFSSPILPGSKVNMKLDYCREKNSVSFCMRDALQCDRVFSSGSFIAGEE
ncbi:MAG: hydroxymyristoyl-ACP dehydratase [Treponema sp.]|nr:hydroxymyristoyl-ACP dehydratase [Treponema sp.]